MAEAVSELIVAVRADISQLKTELEKAKGETKKWGRINVEQTRSLQNEFKKLAPSISNVGQLANSMAAAFGASASKATGLINGLVQGFGAAGGASLAIGATTALVAVLTSEYEASGKAAKEAAEKAKAANEAEQESIADKLKALESELKAKILIANGLDPAAAGESVALDEARKKAQALEAAARAAASAARAASAPGDLQAGILRSIGGDVPAFDSATDEGKAAEKAATAAAQARRQVEVLETMGVLRREIERNDKKKDLAKKTAEDQAKYEADQQKKAMDLSVSRIKEEEDAKVQIVAESGDRVLEEEDAFNAAHLEAAQIRAERETEIDAAVAKTRDEAAAKRAADTATETQQLLGIAQSFGTAVADFLITPLEEGFASLADFAKAAKRLVLGLIAELVKAAIVAAILSALTGGSTTALAGVGGLTGAIGNALSIKGYYADGGPVGTDTVPAMLTPGEYVMPVSAVRAYGADFFDSLRRSSRHGYADGGLVKGGGSGSTTYIVQAFDAPAISRSAGRLDGVSTQRINNRQGALARETLRRNLRG